MRIPPLTHTLERDRDEVRVAASSESLALVDLESYPPFIARKADYFDMMAHLSAQMQALTVISWKAPEQAFHLRLCLVGDDQLMEQTRANRVMIASGNVRCYGRLCLTTHERVFDSARNRTHRLLRSERASPDSGSQLLNVPPGIYSIFIYYHEDPAQEARVDGPVPGAKTDYTVLLRHYPFPPPRVAPVRISSGLFSGSGDDAANQAGNNTITSHRRIW